MSDAIAVVLYECRRVLGIGSQGKLGTFLGSSERTGQRWETGDSTPSAEQLVKLASLVYPRNPNVAAQLAAAMGTNLVALGIAKPPAPPAPPPPPPPPPLPAEDVVDAVVCAAADAIDVTPREVRPALVAAFTRARRLGLSVLDVEKALGRGATAAAAPPAKAEPASKKG